VNRGQNSSKEKSGKQMTGNFSTTRSDPPAPVPLTIVQASGRSHRDSKIAQIFKPVIGG